MLIHDRDFIPFIAAELIEERIATIGAALSEQYAGKKPVFLIVMKGAFMFAAGLLRHFTGECTVYFTTMRSYSGTARGDLNFDGLPDGLEGKDVIVVEDIIDSGNTLAFLLSALHGVSTSSIFTVALLQKDIPRAANVHADMCAFVIPDEFVVGYGLDYHQFGRNLPAIYRLTPSAGEGNA